MPRLGNPTHSLELKKTPPARGFAFVAPGIPFLESFTWLRLRLLIGANYIALFRRGNWWKHEFAL
jgi:hypothetical protein